MYSTLPFLALVATSLTFTASAAALPASAVSKRASPLSKNGITFGFLPDDGDAGGTSTTMAQINKLVGSGGQAATYGYYAQIPASDTFDGSQLTARFDDIVSSGAIFEPAIMPTSGWNGLSSDNDYQAKAIANVLKKFTDAGVQVRLRFAHEMNWYSSDGTYPGGTGDDQVAKFKEAWSTVTSAVRATAPDVKMFWTPNAGSGIDEYKRWMPDTSEIDYCGIDYYPSAPGSFVSEHKDLHDLCASSGIDYAIGETGLSKSVDDDTRIKLADEIMNSKSDLPNLVSISWFNYYKGYDFRIVSDDTYLTGRFKSIFGI